MSTQPLQPAQHTGSYYAATVNHVTDYPILRGEQHADVCVIGAGFSGISTALHLAERGYNVHVVEANRVGWGASGRNGGQVIGGIAGEKVIAAAQGLPVDDVFSELRWAGHEIIRERVKRYKIDCDLKQGYLDVAIMPRHIRALEDEQERLQKAKFPYQTKLLSKAETIDSIGTDAYIGAMLNMGNGHVHPLNLCIGEAMAAVSHGATIYEQSPVLNIEQATRPRVVTANGSIVADSVVMAGNAYHDLDQRMRGMLFPVKSFIIATEPLCAEMVAQINPKDLAVCDPNFVLEYFRLTAEKRLLFGGRISYFGDDPAYIRKKLKTKMTRIYPQLATTRIDYAWGGTIGVTINRVPQFGRFGNNVYYCQGYSGHGVNVTHLAGKIMADAVAGTLEKFDLFAQVKPIRIPGAHLLRKPLVALGLQYYNIKDSL